MSFNGLETCRRPERGASGIVVAGMLLAGKCESLAIVLSVDTTQIETSASPTTHRRRVLVIDDHSDNREMLTAYLTMFGHDVRTAPDGVEGLQVARSFQPEVIFLDIWMPRMDGLETCQRLRRDPLLSEAVVYALSAGSTAELRGAECFDGFFMKPVDLDTLAELVLHPLRKPH